ncbi:C4-dicarboxylate ABC transporter [Alkalibacterium sp. MB6]|uniref:C4-dicarboxylate ABC transporter n=1 Tax=Alkalibacterium sp. MB6 TaxID=2081965 RepID=UPI00137ADAD5|nr:C4-dicarboxylate ABC transporter [Alkalibacterium sp. MB6]
MNSDNLGKILGWLAMALAVVGFFVWNIWLGLAAMVIGLIGLVSTSEKGLNWTAIAFGAIAMIIGII